MSEEIKDPEPSDDVPLEESVSPSSVSSLLDGANAAADRLEKANKELSSLLDRQAALRLEQTLGGSASAGSKKVSKEQREVAAAKKFLEGTGYEDLLDEKK